MHVPAINITKYSIILLSLRAFRADASASEASQESIGARLIFPSGHTVRVNIPLHLVSFAVSSCPASKCALLYADAIPSSISLRPLIPTGFLLSSLIASPVREYLARFLTCIGPILPARSLSVGCSASSFKAFLGLRRAYCGIDADDTLDADDDDDDDADDG